MTSVGLSGGGLSEQRPHSRQSDAVLERLSRLHPKIIDLSLGRTLALLDKLGRPQDHLPPVIHVAGTNGKGSVLAFLRAIFTASGRCSHVYSSPHLVRFHERIRLAGELISEDALIALLEKCEELNGNAGITFFEVTTAAAFYAFSQTPADLLLLETGLGGELDSTNVVTRPALSIITPISMDHTQYLGDTLTEIAQAKAGIIKPAVPCVVGQQPPEALAVIKARAKDCAAPLYIAGEDWSAEPVEQGDFIFHGRGGDSHCPAPNLVGAHQLGNAALAFASAELLSSEQAHQPLVTSVAQRHQGLTTAQWPGRMQKLSGGVLVDRLPPGGELWLDGGHNAAAGAALAQMLAAWSPVHLIYGMLKTKAALDYLRPLVARATSLRAVSIPDEPASLSAAEAAAQARAVGVEARACDSVGQALDDILAGEQPGPIVICGSLYLAGQVLADNF